jgi:hypothetical protein
VGEGVGAVDVEVVASLPDVGAAVAVADGVVLVVAAAVAVAVAVAGVAVVASPAGGLATTVQGSSISRSLSCSINQFNAASTLRFCVDINAFSLRTYFIFIHFISLHRFVNTLMSMSTICV